MTARRILHCIPTMGGGGAERQLSYLAGELIQLGWDVHVALGAGGPNLRRLQESGATIHFLHGRNSYDPAVLWRLTRIIRRVKPALVQVWMLQMEILGSMAARSAGVPWILSERCSDLAYPPTVKHWLRQRMAKGASAIVSNSAGGRQYWEGRLDSRIAHYVIPNALRLDEMTSSSAADLPQTSVPPSDALVLFAGRLIEQKNPETFIKALGRVLERPRTNAVVGGDGPLRSGLVRLTRELGIEERVSFPGYLENLWSWMKKAAMFVSPSLFEGHPNTVMEAAASRCALVVSDIPAHREFLDERSALFVPATDHHSLARGMLEILDNPEAARARAERAFQTVAQWSSARIARQYEQAYLEVLDRSHPSNQRGAVR